MSGEKCEKPLLHVVLLQATNEIIANIEKNCPRLTSHSNLEFFVIVSIALQVAEKLCSFNTAFKDNCACSKVTFKCQVQGCNKDTHNTPPHPLSKDRKGNGNNLSKKESISVPLDQAHNAMRAEAQTQDRNRESVDGVERAAVSGATKADEKRICLYV